MKILQITPERISINTQVPYDSRADYMGDLLFHGLRQLYGDHVIDFPRKDHLYNGYEHGPKLWGRGFSYCGLLDELDTDRSDIQHKIQSNYFDLIVFTSHNTVDHYPHIFYRYLEQIRQWNPTIKLAVVNGKDRPEIYDQVWKYTPYHFQREIPDGVDERLIPISFAIPKEKIVSSVPYKTKLVADIVPADHTHPNRKTHVYTCEEDYYRDYNQSMFAVTVRKAGWDCMRHYEIFANGCIPIFGDIAVCPEKTLTTLPKAILKNITEWPCMNLPKPVFTKNDILIPWQYIDSEKLSLTDYREQAEELLDYTSRYLHTEALAKYFLEKCEC